MELKLLSPKIRSLKDYWKCYLGHITFSYIIKGFIKVNLLYFSMLFLRLILASKFEFNSDQIKLYFVLMSIFPLLFVVISIVYFLMRNKKIEITSVGIKDGKRLFTTKEIAWFSLADDFQLVMSLKKFPFTIRVIGYDKALYQQIIDMLYPADEKPVIKYFKKKV